MAKLTSIIWVTLIGATLCPTLMVQAAPAQDAKKPEVKKPTTPDPKSVAAVNAAVLVLVKEGQAGFKDTTAPLREKSDYFPDPAPAEITPEAILAALEKQLSSDPRVDAYVKWELLSGVPGHFADELAPRATNAYRRAPEPMSHPGLERNKLTSLLYRVGTMKKDRLDEVNRGYAEGLEKLTADNTPILRYRKAMLGRLPANVDTVLAGLDDISLQVRRGIDANPQWDGLAGTIQSWSLSADGRQMDAVMQSLGRLLTMTKDEHNKPYVKVNWSDDVKNAGMHWQDQQPLADAKVQTLIDSLREAAKLLGSAGFKDKK